MDKVLKHFSFKGRANRQRYWLTSLALYGILIGGVLLSWIPIVGPIVLVMAFVAALVGALAVAARRMHDRGRSGWWLLACYLPMILFSALSGAAESSAPDAAAFFGLLSLPFSIWMLVDLGCLRGTQGPNRFGPDPLQPLQEVFA